MSDIDARLEENIRRNLARWLPENTAQSDQVTATLRAYDKRRLAVGDINSKVDASLGLRSDIEMLLRLRGDIV